MHLFLVLSSVILAQSTLSVLELLIWPFLLAVSVAAALVLATGGVPDLPRSRLGGSGFGTMEVVEEAEPLVTREGLRSAVVAILAGREGEGDGFVDVDGPASSTKVDGQGPERRDSRKPNTRINDRQTAGTHCLHLSPFGLYLGHPDAFQLLPSTVS